MATQTLAAALELGAVLSSGAGALLFARALARPPTLGPPRPALWRAHPFTQLTLLGALIVANQIAFNVYVRAVHHGDPSFVARYLPAGWFDVVPNHPAVVLVARLVGPGARWLAPTVLRVQAFLELPFTLLAYLSIARLLDRALYRLLVRPSWLCAASLAFTAPFCVVELGLANPWTADDLWLRAASCALTPAWLAWLARGERGGAEFPSAEGRPVGVVGLLTFVLGALATAYLVLVMYDVTLLYNLGHMPLAKGPLAAAWSIAMVAHLGDGRFDGFVHRLVTASHAAAPPPTLGVRAATSALAAFTALFFVPSLALRYDAYRPLAQLLGLALVLVGLAVGLVLALRAARPRPAEVIAAALGAVIAFVCGAAAAITDVGGLTRARDFVVEELLLRKAGAFLAVSVVAWWLAERALAALAPRRTGA